MTEPPTSDAAYESEPRRQRGLGRSPLRAVPPQGRRSVLDALDAHDAWVNDHGGQLRGTRAGDAHAPARVEPVAPVVAVEVGREVELADANPKDLNATKADDTGPLSLSGLGLGREVEAGGSIADRLARLRDARGLGA